MIENSKFKMQSSKLSKKLPHKQLGFTLIELLVTMAIIGILASISLFAMRGARKSARDARRKADLESIRSALEIYKADCNVYPASLPNAGNKLDGSACTPANTNTYIEKIPGDPLSGNYAYNRLTTVTYTLCSTLEDPPSSPDITNCAACAAGACKYKVTNP